MSEENLSYQPPDRPLSFRRVVRKILDEPDYARFIHAEILKARKEDSELDENFTAAMRDQAFETVRAHCTLPPNELGELRLPETFGKCRCTDLTKTDLYLLDFATPVHVWPADETE